MALFGSPKPVVLKEGSAAEEQLRQMEDAKGTLSPRAEARLEKDLRLVRAGIDGERHILYELKNSHMDMFILQDLFLEHEGLTAQIDFLVITPQRNFVIECKNLVGNIEINSRGDFIRTFEGGKKEGIYSPVTQNHRHLELIKALRKAGRSTVANLVAGSSTDDAYRSLVVLANPKTILNDRYAKRDVKAQVIRADQLIETIKRINNEKGPGRDKTFRSVTQDCAEWFLAQHKPREIDYLAKYREKPKTEQKPSRPEPSASNNSDSEPLVTSVSEQSAANEVSILCPKCGAPMVKRTARKGARAGKPFYGCSNYHKCRGIVNLER